MAKQIEDFVIDLDFAEIGVQVVVRVVCLEEYRGVVQPFKIHPEKSGFARFKAMSQQIKRVLGFPGCLDSVIISGYDEVWNTIQVQLSYRVGVKGDETGGMRTMDIGNHKTVSKRKKGKK